MFSHKMFSHKMFWASTCSGNGKLNIFTLDDRIRTRFSPRENWRLCAPRYEGDCVPTDLERSRNKPQSQITWGVATTGQPSRWFSKNRLLTIDIRIWKQFPPRGNADYWLGNTKDRLCFHWSRGIPKQSAVGDPTLFPWLTLGHFGGLPSNLTRIKLTTIRSMRSNNEA